MRQAEATFRGNFWLYSHQRNNLYYLNRLLLRHLLRCLFLSLVKKHTCVIYFSLVDNYLPEQTKEH